MYSNTVTVDFRPQLVVGQPKLSLVPKRQDIHQIEVPQEHKMDHLSEEQIDEMVSYCLENQRWRDAMLLVLGVSTGLRASDLCRVRVSDMVEGLKTGYFRILEQKKTQTGSNRKRHCSPVRCYVNRPVKEMLDIFMAMTPGMTYESYLFENRSLSPSNAFKDGVYTAPYPHINRQRVYLIVHGLYEKCGFYGKKCGSHSLRKTGAATLQHTDTLPADAPMKNPYGMMMAQLFLNHASAQSTMHYLNEAEDMRRSCVLSMTLGLKPVLDFKEKHHIGSWNMSFGSQ